MELLSTPRVNSASFLEFTRPMDSVTSSDEGYWAERKKLKKNERYGMHLYLINYLLRESFNGLSCTGDQYLFSIWSFAINNIVFFSLSLSLFSFESVLKTLFSNCVVATRE